MEFKGGGQTKHADAEGGKISVHRIIRKFLPLVVINNDRSPIAMFYRSKNLPILLMRGITNDCSWDVTLIHNL